MNAWINEGDLHAEVVALCAAPYHTGCGNGSVDTPCEACDDGSANSDTTPDACRTTCQRAACGDGIVDGGEQCDDGNLESCDGCSATCVAEPGLVCGDGVPELACGEQCDDGNTVDGDGCTDPCRLERIPGGGSSRTDCLVEWSIDNAANVPLYDRRGAISGIQQCVDGDPRCDFDGGVPGSCTFHLRVCANNTDVEGCSPPARLASWELTSPSVKRASTDPVLAAVRAALSTVAGTTVGPSTHDVCTGWMNVTVPLHSSAGGFKSGKLTLKARAETYERDRDSDKVKLVCLPTS